MQIMQPREQPRLLIADIEEGLPVTIYARGWKNRVADALIVRRSPVVGFVCVKLDLACKKDIHSWDIRECR